MRLAKEAALISLVPRPSLSSVFETVPLIRNTLISYKDAYMEGKGQELVSYHVICSTEDITGSRREDYIFSHREARQTKLVSAKRQVLP